MTPATRRKLTFLAGFAAYFGALWALWDSPAIYPVKIFVVLLHEASHALAAVATGGSVQRIVLDPYQGGACYCPGGNAFLTLSAGYLGSLGWGAALVEAGRARRIPADAVVGVIGAAVVALTLFFVRGGFGIGFGLAFGAALVWAARSLSKDVNRALVLGLGLTSALYAILDIKSDVLDRPHLESDAHMLGEITGVPTVVWGTLWIVAAVAASALLFRRSYRNA